MATIKGERAFLPVNIAVLTVSDTRTPATDRSGQTLVERIEKAGHRVAARDIVPDDKDAVIARLKAWIADADIDAVIATGGTGVPISVSTSTFCANRATLTSRRSDRSDNWIVSWRPQARILTSTLSTAIKKSPSIPSRFFGQSVGISAVATPRSIRNSLSKC